MTRVWPGLWGLFLLASLALGARPACAGTAAFLFQFGTDGSGNGQFYAPNGVAVSPNGTIVVADSANGRIEVFH